MLHRPYIRIGSRRFIVDELAAEFPSLENAFGQFVREGHQLFGPVPDALPCPTNAFYLTYPSVQEGTPMLIAPENRELIW